jgi:hypothetical protein
LIDDAGTLADKPLTHAMEVFVATDFIFGRWTASHGHDLREAIAHGVEALRGFDT